MQITPTPLADVFLVEITPIADERGLFARTCDEQLFARAGLCTHWPQCNTSFNLWQGTLRGLHYQIAPHAEAKLVRCTRGAIFDVAVDLRPDSPTFCQWFGCELTADNRAALYVGEGLAHGFLTLSDHSEVFYQMGRAYHPDSARGVRWDDPAFAITWPSTPLFMAERDRSYEDFHP